jgi:glucose/arabinose dehydrogenase
MLIHRNVHEPAGLPGGLVALMLASASSLLPQDAGKKEPQDLPQIPAPDPAAAQLPAGYKAEVAFSGLMYPSSIEFDDAGHVYIAECGYMPGDTTKPARILRAKLGSEEHLEVVARDLSAPITDLLWHDGELYISQRGKITVLADGKLEDLVSGLPSYGDHSNNQLSLGPDGRLYFGQGTATNSGVVGADNFAFGWPKEHPYLCETTAWEVRLKGQIFESADPRTKDKQARARTSAYQPFGTAASKGALVEGTLKANGTVMSMELDGTDLKPYAWGFRNPYGVLWGPDMVLYTSDAGSDERGSRPIANAPEKLWIVLPTAWYGWPDFEGGIPVTDERFKPEQGPAPEFLFDEHPHAQKPILTFEPHASVTQLEFCRSRDFGYEGELFLASSGDQSPVTAAHEVRAGYWIKRIDLTDGKAQTFFQARPDALGPPGLEYVTTAGPKRLVDLRFTPQGDALYVVDIGPLHYAQGEGGPKPVAFPGTGVVWRITRLPQPPPPEKPRR